MRTMLLLLVSTIVLTCLPTALLAEEPLLKTINWSDLKESDLPQDGKVLPAESAQKGKILKIENTKNAPETIPLFEIKDPKITKTMYAIRGNIRYQEVQGKSYLEMWNHFPDGTQYFSRTLTDQSGPTQNLKGTSDWRPFALPFFINEKSKGRPDRLTINLVLKGSGTVYLSPLRLEQYDNMRQAQLAPGVWRNHQIGGILGGIFGLLLGILGALIGILAGRGRARRFVMALLLVGVLTGILMIAIGTAALFTSQPYAVWFPLLIIGIVTVVALTTLRPIIRRRYEAWELQQISATDLGMTTGP